MLLLLSYLRAFRNGSLADYGVVGGGSREDERGVARVAQGLPQHGHGIRHAVPVSQLGHALSTDHRVNLVMHPLLDLGVVK